MVPTYPNGNFSFRLSTNIAILAISWKMQKHLKKQNGQRLMSRKYTIDAKQHCVCVRHHFENQNRRRLSLRAAFSVQLGIPFKDCQDCCSAKVPDTPFDFPEPFEGQPSF